jgi:hypothetical protein
MFSYHELKKLIYEVETGLGIVAFVAAWFLTRNPVTASTPVCAMLPATVLVLSGFICLLFGLTTYLLRDDPDIWR